jgi:hypothetical protein
MWVTKLFTVSVGASLLLGAVAHASDAAGVGEARLPWNVETFQRVLPAEAQYPELVWTSAIGTGTAAALERGASFQHASPAKAQYYPEPDWTSTFGTGAAAALER